MGLSSSQMHPDELVHFRKLTREVPLESLDIPALPENRRRTNLKWMLVLTLFLFVLMPFMIYTLAYSDLDRLSGYDNCGNVCGQKNDRRDDISCSGKDYTNQPHLKINRQTENYRTVEVRECVGTGADTVHHDYEHPLEIYLDSVKWQITISCLLSIVIAVGMLFLFRYATHFVVWGILLGCLIAVVLVAGYFWIAYINMPPPSSPARDQATPVLIAAIAITIFAIAIGIILACFRKKVHLVILLFRETAKAVFTMPRLMTVPVVCVLTVLLLGALFTTTTVYMESAGILKRISDGSYSYEKTPVMVFTMVYNLIAFIWLSEFFVGIQYMIIAGAVSQWYFCRDKTVLGNPIRTATSITFKYHLGTVAMGSMLITIIMLIKMAILSLIKNNRVRALVNNHCLEPIERFFKFLSKNAYIITALHGQSFLKSGRRAARLIYENIGDIIAVNSIGDFVLGVAKILIVILSVLLSAAVLSSAHPYADTHGHFPAFIVVGIVSAIAAYVVFGVFETGIDTIFICYCEDSILNDGMARPYFMTRDLMEFVQKSKEIYGKN